MDPSPRIACVGFSDRSAAAVASVLDECDVTVVDDVAAVDAVTSADCYAVDASDAATFEKRLLAVSRSDTATPIVAFPDREWYSAVRDAIAAEATHVVRRAPNPDDDDLHLLVRRVRRAVTDSADRTGGSAAATGTGFDATDRIEPLRDLASALGDADSTAVVYDRLVERADSVFSFDACAIAEADGDELAVRAGRGPVLQLDVDPLGADDGIAGRTLAERRTFNVANAAEVEWARPTDERCRSVLSVPLGEGGVFQFVSTTVDAYDETDVLVAELLCAIAAYAAGQTASEAVLTAERDWFEALFENVPDAAVQYTVDDGILRIEDVNAAFVRLFGYEPVDAIGEPVTDLIVPSGVEDPIEVTLETARSDERFDREVTRRTTDGQQPFLLRNVPVSTDGTTHRGYLIYTDIRSQKRRERELQRKNERLDEFASIVSHDLRNPLAIAMGNADLALERESLETVTIVSEELERMERMIDDLLALARQGEVVGETSAVDLDSAAEEAWNHVRTSDATLSVGDLPVVDGDRPRIEELLENCYRNAIEHGGTDVTVTVGPIERDATATGTSTPADVDAAIDGSTAAGFYIEDDGPGFPDGGGDDVLAYGFTTAEDGTGFGLAIVAEIARAHGWSVATTNVPEGGARIEFRTDPTDRD